MKPAPFTYHRASSAEEAVSLLQELGDESKILAGGQSLVPIMNFRLAQPSALVDVSRLDQLAYIRRDGNAVRIGALTRHRDIELSIYTASASNPSASVPAVDVAGRRPSAANPAAVVGFEVLPRSARWIGHLPIRTRGTIGGSLAHADPTAEWCVLAQLLDAEVTVLGASGSRTIPAHQWFAGFMETDCGAEEMVTEVTFPRPRPTAALTEYAQRHGDFGIAVAAVALDVRNGCCADVAISLGGVRGTPVRMPDLERDLSGQPATADTWRAAGAAAAAAVDPPSDVHGSVAYRKHLVGTLVERAFAQAVATTAPVLV
ncbi:MAG: xanthine dehydrogenase family protein subunit M [Nakamurella sp.]